MMKRFLSLFLALFALFLLSVPAIAATRRYTRPAAPIATPKPSPTIAPVSSFELFWPIAPGKVRGDSLYSLKLLKEKIRGFLIFSNFKKSDYYITLSEKRVVESEELLLRRKDYENAKLSLEDSQTMRQMALDNMMAAKDGGVDVNDLKSRFTSSLEKQRALLIYIQVILPEDKRSLVGDNLSKLNGILAKLQ